MTRVAIYTRISRDRDGEGAGVERQEAECLELVERRGWEVVGTFKENNASAFRGRRPVWARLLEAVRAGEVDVVVAWANDRLYRRARDQLDLLEALREAGGRVATVRDGEVDPRTGSGRMVMGVLANVAEFESERKSERHLSQHDEIAGKGRWPGGRAPHGYRLARAKKGTTLAPIPERGEALRRAAEVLLDGGTVRAAADLMGLDPRTARRALLNPAVAGLRVHRGEELSARWPAILDRRTWEDVRDLLEGRNEPRGPRPRYPLTGLLRCPSGHALVGRRQRYGRTYSCVEKGCPTQATARARDVEELVTSRASDVQVVRDGVGDPEAAPRELREERDRLRDQVDAWAAKAALAGMGPSEIRAGRRALAERLAELEDEIAAAAPAPRRTFLRDLAEPEEDFGEWVRDPETRAWLEAIVDHAVLRPAGRNPRVPVEERVEIAWREDVEVRIVTREGVGLSPRGGGA